MRRPRTILAGLLALVTLATTGCLADLAHTGPLWDTVGAQHVEPEPNQDTCVTHATGEYLVNTNNAVVDGLCLDGGVLLIQADNVTVRNSTLTGAPPDYFITLAVLAGSDNVYVHDNIIDCGGDTALDLDAASQGIRSPDGQTSGHVERTEIRDCSDGIQAASNWDYNHNLIHSPDNCDIVNVCDLHADGVQWDTENDGSPIHDVLFEWNNIEFPLASASFQWHNSQVETEGPYNIVVRYNSFEGGGYAVRLPNFGGGGNEFYGNRLEQLVFPPANPYEFGVCTSIDHGTDPIDVWGTETGDPTDSLDRGIPDDANIHVNTGLVLQRTDCE